MTELAIDIARLIPAVPIPTTCQAIVHVKIDEMRLITFQVVAPTPGPGASHRAGIVGIRYVLTLEVPTQAPDDRGEALAITKVTFGTTVASFLTWLMQMTTSGVGALAHDFESRLCLKLEGCRSERPLLDDDQHHGCLIA